MRKHMGGIFIVIIIIVASNFSSCTVLVVTIEAVTTQVVGGGGDYTIVVGNDYASFILMFHFLFISLFVTNHPFVVFEHSI